MKLAAIPDPETESSTVAGRKTIRITLKLFALLSGYLPDGAKRNEVEIVAPEGATPTSIIAMHNIPAKLCALVFLNGVFVHVRDRAARRLADGDVLAIWPPVAGG